MAGSSAADWGKAGEAKTEEYEEKGEEMQRLGVVLFLILSIVFSVTALFMVIVGVVTNPEWVIDNSRPFDMVIMWLAGIGLCGGMAWVFGNGAYELWNGK